MLRAACEKPDPNRVVTVGELAAFSVRQNAAIDVCDGRRAALVAIADAHRQIVTPKPWWSLRR